MNFAVVLLTVYGRFCSALLVAAIVFQAPSKAEGAEVPGAPCEWKRPETQHSVTVRTTEELVKAVAGAKPGTLILVEDGEYRLRRMLDIAVPGTVLAGKNGDRGRVVLRGDGMTEHTVGVAISVSTSNVTIADLTVGYVGYHGIQIRGERGVSNAMVHGVRVIDTGQQLIKGSSARNGVYSSNCVVACSELEYSEHAPSDYTDGIDVLGGDAWVVRDNRISRIRGPAEAGFRAGPAVLFWRNSRDTVVERNVILDSSRGIALGLTASAGAEPDHDHGSIRRNVIVNLHPWGDEGIEVNDGRDVQVDHNTVFTGGQVRWSISIRFPRTTALVQDNLTNQQIILRAGGHAEQKGNVSTAKEDWFVGLASGDARLVPGRAIDAGAY